MRSSKLDFCPKAAMRLSKSALLYKGKLHKECSHDYPSQVGFLYSE